MPGSRAVKDDRREEVTGRPAVRRCLKPLEPPLEVREHGLQLGKRPQLDASSSTTLAAYSRVAGTFGDFCNSTNVRTDSTPAAVSIAADRITMSLRSASRRPLKAGSWSLRRAEIPVPWRECLIYRRSMPTAHGMPTVFCRGLQKAPCIPTTLSDRPFLRRQISLFSLRLISESF